MEINYGNGSALNNFALTWTMEEIRLPLKFPWKISRGHDKEKLNFVVIMEKNAFTQKLKEYFRNIDSLNINNNLIPYINNELNSNESYQWYDQLKNKELESINEYNEFNDKLKIYAWHGTFILIGLFVLYISILFMFYKLSLKKLIVEHIILISLIGVYEYWFFINIILPYKIISVDELNYIVISCMIKKLNMQNGININSTIVDACKLI